MSTISAQPRPTPAGEPLPALTVAPMPAEEIPPLEQGDRLSRDEFHRRYEAMPGIKAELIEGVVHVASPVRLRSHGRPEGHLGGWLFNYEAMTPGVLTGHNSTTRLDLDNEPQPDLLLMIDPARGGQAKIAADDYIEGAPELVAEIAGSTVSIDVHTKLNVYRRTGVREYIVWRVRDSAIDWYERSGSDFVKKSPGDDGTLRSTIFPGLWLDAAALITGDLAKVIAAVQRGTADPAHGAFVEALASRGPASA